MKKLIFAACAAISFAGFAARIDESKVNSEAAMKARDARIKQFGGLLKIEGKGHVTVFNGQKTVTDADIDAAMNTLKRFANGFRLEIKPSAGFQLADAKKRRVEDGAGVCVYVVEDPALPMSLIALEDGWGMVNVAPLKDGDPKPDVFKLRFRKEFIRVSALVFSGAVSQYQVSPLQCVTSPAGLDKVVGDDYAMDSLMGIASYLPKVGVVRDEYMTYLKACQMGLAPQPTNDIQKAVWAKVHDEKERGPANAIKIKPPKK